MLGILEIAVLVLIICIPIAVGMIARSPFVGQAVAKIIENRWGKAGNRDVQRLEKEIKTMKDTIEQMQLDMKSIKESNKFIEKLLNEGTDNKLLDEGENQNN